MGTGPAGQLKDPSRGYFTGCQQALDGSHLYLDLVEGSAKDRVVDVGVVVYAWHRQLPCRAPALGDLARSAHPAEAVAHRSEQEFRA